MKIKDGFKLLLGVGIVSAYLLNRNKLQIQKPNRESEERQSEDDAELAELVASFVGPIYEQGDSVIVISPMAAEGTWQDYEPPIHATVQQIAYVQDIDMYAYKLEGLDGWYNENWLQYDLYLPKILKVIEVNTVETKEARIDALLDAMNDYRELAERFGDKEYSDKVAELKREIAELAKE